MAEALHSPPNRVRELRKARRLTLKQLSPMIGGLTFAHLARIECGQRNLNLYWMEKIAAALGVVPADLLAQEIGGLSERERLLIDTYREVPVCLRGSYDALCDHHQRYRAADVLGSPEIEPRVQFSRPGEKSFLARRPRQTP